MLRYLYANELETRPTLRRSMFADRADQFHNRLGWDVHVDAQGEERDQYDALNPLYVIWEQPDGTHGGSMRFLPTTGPVMVNDVFGHLLSEGPISSPLIWECTRFCLARRAGPGIAAALMLGGGEIMKGFGIAHFAAVFDYRMERVYRAIGASPEVLGADGAGRQKISVGLWSFSASARARVALRAGVSPELSRYWFERAFGRRSAGAHRLSA